MLRVVALIANGDRWAAALSRRLPPPLHINASSSLHWTRTIALCTVLSTAVIGRSLAKTLPDHSTCSPHRKVNSSSSRSEIAERFYSGVQPHSSGHRWVPRLHV